METEKLLEQLNNFTRREHTADEVYIFSAILCDNEIDRDNEQFSLSALNQLKTLFVGKTGIFDHNAKGSNQTARIFSTEVITDSGKLNSLGEAYVYLKANAYMIRTSSNEDLIKEIDGGIKKEVSVSCTSATQKCSVCGANLKKKVCSHVKGNVYNGKRCYVILEDITDAYEWSFVAVPAQINAGITKFFGGDTANGYSEKASPQLEILEKIYSEIRADVIRLGFLAQPKISGKSLEAVVDRMSLDELYDLKKTFMGDICGELKPQITAGYKKDVASFKM